MSSTTIADIGKCVRWEQNELAWVSEGESLKEMMLSDSPGLAELGRRTR